MTQKSELSFRQSFKNLGFSESETKILVYLFELKEGASLKEISQNTSLSFSVTHFALSNLTIRGILECAPSEADDLYTVISEQDFITWIERKKIKNEKVYSNAQDEIMSFLSGLTEENWKPHVKYYEGIEGIIEIYESMIDSVEEGGNIHSWLDIDRISKYLGEYLYRYIKKRQAKNIKSHDIVPDNETNRKHDKKKENREIKFVGNLPINGDIRIFNNKVAVITFDEEKPVGFVFEGELIVSLFRAIFKSQWEAN